MVEVLEDTEDVSTVDQNTELTLLMFRLSDVEESTGDFLPVFKEIGFPLCVEGIEVMVQA
jgi:hypothetical protein